jgi:DNA-directed RNA polymerase specialized sigma24 family protein
MAEPTTHLWIQALESGDDVATERLWNEFFQQLARYAEGPLGKHHRVVDGEDIAAQAIFSFVNGLRRGQLQAESRDELWRILAGIAFHKARGHVRQETAEKRGGGVRRGNSIFDATASGGAGGFDRFLGSAATEETAEAMLQQCSHLLTLLSDSEREIARLKLERYSHKEISEKLGYSVGHIDRCVRKIKEKWIDAGFA